MAETKLEILQLHDTPSKQTSHEDEFSSVARDIVSPPSGVDFANLEQLFYEENHISAACIDLIAVAVTKRGYDFELVEGAKENEKELTRLRELFSDVHQTDSFADLLAQVIVSYETTANGYLEVIRNGAGIITGLEWAPASSIRALRRHVGFVQSVGAKLIYFNNYMPDPEARQQAIKNWKSLGGEAEEKKLKVPDRSGKQIFNPNLTEIMHFKGRSARSRYYGFPKTYSLGKINLLDAKAADFNIGLLSFHKILPFFLNVKNGSLTEEQKKAFVEYIKTLQSSQEWGEVALFENSDVSVEKLGQEEKEGSYLELRRENRKDIAMRMQVPLDLLTTENSNRATIEIAERLLDENVASNYRRVFENRFNQMIALDLGVKSYRLRFPELDTTDQFTDAKTHSLYVQDGVLSPNEVRTEIGRKERDGGDEYKGGQSEEAKPPVTQSRDSQLYRLLAAGYRGKMKKVWRSQEADLLAKLRDATSTVQRLTGKTPITQVDYETLLFREWDGWVKLIFEPTKEFLQRLLAERGGEVFAQLGVAGTFDVANPRAEEFIRGHGLETARTINETTKDALRLEIAEAVEAGESAAQISSRIQDRFNDFTDWRAETVARTETGYGYNQGSLEGYRQSGVVQSVLVQDGDYDAECQLANGKIWTLEEAARHPLQHPNCTRSFSPVVSEG